MPLGKTNLIFNDEVRCPSFPYEAEFIPLTTVQANPNRTVKQSFVHDPHDWMFYTINMSQLKEAQRDAVMDFVKVVGGNIDSFLFRDEYGWGYQLPRTQIGVGTGSQTNFQVKQVPTVGANSREFEIWNIEDNGTIRCWVNGVEIFTPANFTVNWVDDGSIDIAVPPPAPQIVEVSCDYLRRVRFNGNFRNMLRTHDTNDMVLGLAEEGVD